MDATRSELIGSSVVEILDRHRFRSVPQLVAELTANGNGGSSALDLGTEPNKRIGDAIADDERLYRVGDVVFSRASLIAGRTYTARVGGTLAVQTRTDLTPFVGSQRRVDEAVESLVLHAQGENLVRVAAVPAEIGHTTGYAVLRAPADVTTDQFGSIQPDALEVNVVSSDRLGAGEIEAAAIRTAAAQLLGDGRSLDTLSLLGYAIHCNDDSFRRPVLPLTDLFVAAGLEERDGEWGPAGEVWSTAVQTATERIIDDLSIEFGLTRSERDRLERLASLWRSWRSGATVDLGVVFDAPVAGGVLDAFVELWRPSVPVTTEAWIEQRRFVESLARLQPDAPVVAFLRGVIDSWVGDATAAHAHFSSAVESSARDFGSAQHRLGLLELDRGRVESAVSMLAPHSLAHDGLEAILDRIRADRDRADRTDPCRCGSGRRYRLCCARQLRLTVADRLVLLDLRLGLFLRQAPWSTQMDRLADIVSTEWGVMSFPEALAEPLVQDILVVEAGGASAYMAARRGLITDVDAEILAQYNSRRRTVFDVGTVFDGIVDLVDPDSTASISLPDFAIRGSLDTDDAVLVRTILLGGETLPVGPPVRIPASHVPLLRVTMGSRPTAEQLLGWIARRSEILRPSIDLGGAIDLRPSVEVEFDLDDLARRALES